MAPRRAICRWESPYVVSYKLRGCTGGVFARRLEARILHPFERPAQDRATEAKHDKPSDQRRSTL